MRRTFRLAIAALACIPACASPAWAAEPVVWSERLRLCVNIDVTITDRDALGICSAIVDDPEASPEERTIALLARANFRLAMHDSGAIADFEAAIQSAPTDRWRARAHFGRAKAYHLAGDKDRAVVEVAVAASYDPEGFSGQLR